MPFLYITILIKTEIYNFSFGQPEFEIKFLYKMMNASTHGKYEFANQQLNAGFILCLSTKEQPPDRNMREELSVFSVQWVTMGWVNLFQLLIFKISKMKVLKALRPWVPLLGNSSPYMYGNKQVYTLKLHKNLHVESSGPCHGTNTPQHSLAEEHSDNCKAAPDQSSKTKQVKILNFPLCKDKSY